MADWVRLEFGVRLDSGGKMRSDEVHKMPYAVLRCDTVWYGTGLALGMYGHVVESEYHSTIVFMGLGFGSGLLEVPRRSQTCLPK